jgi:hypothetical protein
MPDRRLLISDFNETLDLFWSELGFDHDFHLKFQPEILTVLPQKIAIPINFSHQSKKR